MLMKWEIHLKSQKLCNILKLHAIKAKDIKEKTDNLTILKLNHSTTKTHPTNKDKDKHAIKAKNIKEKTDNLMTLKTNHRTTKTQPTNRGKDNLKKDSCIRSSPCGAAETNPTRNHEIVGSIPGLSQWVKDLVLLWAVVLVADSAQIWCCCGCGVGWQLQLWLDP